MSIISLLLHPVSLVLCEVIIASLAISFTSPSSIIRPATLPLLGIATWLVTVTCTQRIPRMSLASIVAGNGPTYLLRYIDLVLLSRWSYEAGGPTNSSGPQSLDRQKTVVGVGSKGEGGDSGKGREHAQGAILGRLRFGLNTTLASRHVNTLWEVKNVPPFSASNPHHVPSRGSFLRRNAIIALLCYIVVDLFSLGVQPERNAVLFAAQNVPFFARLGDVSTEQIAVRIVSSLTLWLNIYCITRMGYSILAIIAVGTGLSQVSAWRPPFGQLADAYTVRSFWG